MNILDFDNKKVRIKCIDGNTYEGIAEYYSSEYNEHEYGNDEESLMILNIIFYKNDILKIELIDSYTEEYGLAEESLVLETFCEVEDILYEEDKEMRTRIIKCLKDNINKVEDKEKAYELIKEYGDE